MTDAWAIVDRASGRLWRSPYDEHCPVFWLQKQAKHALASISSPRDYVVTKVRVIPQVHEVTR